MQPEPRNIDNEKKKNAELFHSLCISLVAGLSRSHAAKLVSNTARIAILKVMTTEKDSKEYRFVAADTGIDDLSAYDFQCFEYVSESNHLVYLTALFDTFLSDVTKFLIYMNPGPFKDDLSSDYERIEKATSVNELKKTMIDEKVRQLSYKSFKERISSLRRAYGLKIHIAPEHITLLDDISSVRNAIAHDQSFLDLDFNNDGSILLQQSSCSMHPVPLEQRIYFRAWGVFAEVCKALYVAINDQIFGVTEGERIDEFLKQIAVRNPKV